MEFRDAWAIACKDLRIELRSRVLTNQIAPYTLLIVVLFGFALDADTRTLRDTGPGLFWVAVLLIALLAIHRAVKIEDADAARERILLTPVSPSSVFLGKSLALCIQLIVLEILLFFVMLALFDLSVEKPLLVCFSAVLATIGVATAGTLYGVIAAGVGVRETLLPILLLPVLAPIAIGATRAFGDAFGRVDTDGWAWFGLLAVFAVVYTVLGMFSYGQLMEDA